MYVCGDYHSSTVLRPRVRKLTKLAEMVIETGQRIHSHSPRGTVLLQSSSGLWNGGDFSAEIAKASDFRTSSIYSRTQYEVEGIGNRTQPSQGKQLGKSK